MGRHEILRADPASPPPRFDPASLGPWARSLTLGPADQGQEAIAASTLLDEAHLARRIEAHAERLDDVALPVAASAWSKDLTTVLVPGILAAWTLQGIGVDASPGNVELHLEHDQPAAARLVDPTRIAAGDPERDLALTSLVGDHLAPLFETLHATSGLSKKVLWGNLGPLVAWIYDRMAEKDPEDARVQADRARLLEADQATWADGPNPIQQPVRYEPLDLDGLPDRIPVRQTCCLKHLIPDDRACSSCPQLSHDDRRALLEAWRDNR